MTIKEIYSGLFNFKITCRQFSSPPEDPEKIDSSKISTDATNRKVQSLIDKRTQTSIEESSKSLNQSDTVIFFDKILVLEFQVEH